MTPEWGFNPRPREGGDSLFGGKKVDPVVVSIHAPAKGATSVLTEDDQYPHVSIHAPAKGATRLPSLVATGRFCFNPRPREGGDESRRVS